MEDVIRRIEAIKKNVETLKDKKIRLEERAKKEEENFLAVVKQIKDFGYDPKTLKDDLQKMEQTLLEDITAQETEIAKTKVTLDEIENNVAAV